MGPGFWAPAGSREPINCNTSSVLLCPGAAADEVFGGGQPIILQGGAAIQETWSVAATITLDHVHGVLRREGRCVSGLGEGRCAGDSPGHGGRVARTLPASD